MKYKVGSIKQVKQVESCCRSHLFRSGDKDGEVVGIKGAGCDHGLCRNVEGMSMSLLSTMLSDTFVDAP